MIKCDLCNKQAVVHETTIHSGVQKQVHLCEEHAAAAGIELGQQPMNQILTQFVICKEGERSGTPKRLCRKCRTSFASFRRTGQLGCPDCYDAFQEPLGPMIERAQNGGTSHVGKCPRRGGGSIDRRLHVERLFRDLESAVAAEQYELAAELRDRLRNLDTDHPASRPGGGPAGETSEAGASE